MLKGCRVTEGGKPKYLTPGEFTEESDYIKEAPTGERADSNIAETVGNYNWWTNLYHVGQPMW